MDVDDFVEPEVAAAAAATAAVLSPTVRNLLHKGAVYGVTGVLLAGDALTAFGRGVTRGIRSAAAAPEGATAALPRERTAPEGERPGGESQEYIIEEERA